MRRTRLAAWIVMMSAVLVGCSTGSVPSATTTPSAVPTQGGTRVAFVSTLVPRPTDTPTPPTLTPVPTETRVVNTITALSPAPTRVAITVAPRVTSTPRPTSTPNALTGATTSTPTSGTREYIAPNARFRLRYPEMWTAGPQGSTTVAFSPERGSDRIAGFLIEPVTNPVKNPEQDLRDILNDTSPSMPLSVVKEPFPTVVDGAAGFRADIRVTLPAATPNPRTPPSGGGTPGAGPSMYMGSFLIVERNGMTYRVGVFARDGDAATLMQAEEVLASLRFT